jgi:hypothetical protein
LHHLAWLSTERAGDHAHQLLVAALLCTTCALLFFGRAWLVVRHSASTQLNRLLIHPPASVGMRCRSTLCAGFTGRCNSSLRPPVGSSCSVSPRCGLNRYRWCVPPRVRHASTAAAIDAQLCHHFVQAGAAQQRVSLGAQIGLPLPGWSSSRTKSALPLQAR